VVVLEGCLITKNIEKIVLKKMGKPPFFNISRKNL
jgi:hypothetical protein